MTKPVLLNRITMAQSNSLIKEFLRTLVIINIHMTKLLQLFYYVLQPNNDNENNQYISVTTKSINFTFTKCQFDFLL